MYIDYLWIGLALTCDINGFQFVSVLIPTLPERLCGIIYNRQHSITKTNHFYIDGLGFYHKFGKRPFCYWGKIFAKQEKGSKNWMLVSK